MAAFAALAASCAGGVSGGAPRERPEEPAAVATLPERLPAPPRRPPTVYVPGGAPAQAYASPALKPDPHPRRLDSFSRGLLDVVEEAAGAAEAPAPIPDDRRHALARDIARLYRTDRPPPSEALRFLTSHYGIAEADPFMFTMAGPPQEASALQSVRYSLPNAFKGGRAWNRVGVGSHRGRDDKRVGAITLWRRFLVPILGIAPPVPETTMTVVLLLWDQYLELAPVPRHLPSGKSALIAGRFLGSYRNPQVVVTMPGGYVRRLIHSTRGDSFEAELRCGFGDGRYQVEMVASDASGPLVLANFPVYCGVAPPTDISAYDDDDPDDIDPAQAEQEIYSLINQDRRTAGVLPLVWDNRLAAIARAHSRDMAAGGYIAHVSPTTGDAQSRVRKAGLQYPVVAENVGQEGGVRQAHQGFMNSPGHRANVLHPQAAFVGIGVVVNRRRGGGPLIITQLFAGGR